MVGALYDRRQGQDSKQPWARGMDRAYSEGPAPRAWSAMPRGRISRPSRNNEPGQRLMATDAVDAGGLDGGKAPASLVSPFGNRGGRRRIVTSAPRPQAARGRWGAISIQQGFSPAWRVGWQPRPYEPTFDGAAGAALPAAIPASATPTSMSSFHARHCSG
jgi:hypothetical protein